MSGERAAAAWVVARAPEARLVWRGAATGWWWALVGPRGADALVAGRDPGELLHRIVRRRAGTSGHGSATEGGDRPFPSHPPV